MPTKQPAGTERETQILRLATDVMKWPPVPDDVFPNARQYGPLTVWNDDIHINQLEGWDPFADLADAWMLVEKLTEYGFYRIDGNGKVVTFSIYPKISEPIWAEGATICEAICETALQFATLSKRRELIDGPDEERG